MGMSLHKGPISKNDLRNGEERLQYHRGRLKLIRKEFGKLFELEFSSPEVKELKTFAKHSDVKKPKKDAMPSSGDSSVATGETEQSSTSGEILIKP